MYFESMFIILISVW